VSTVYTNINETESQLRQAIENASCDDESSKAQKRAIDITIAQMRWVFGEAERGTEFETICHAAAANIAGFIVNVTDIAEDKEVAVDFVLQTVDEMLRSEPDAEVEVALQSIEGGNA
jgi:hypothetical protein